MRQIIDKFSIYLLLVLLGLGSSSCSKELGRYSHPLLPSEAGEEVALTVNFPHRTLVGHSQASSARSLRATIGAQDYEQSLQDGTIHFLVFEDDGTGQPGLLKRVEPVVELSHGLPETGVSGKVFFRDNGTLHVVPTANIKWTKEERDKLLGLSFAEVSKFIIKQPAGEHNWFPMAGEPVKLDTKTLGGTPLNFYLERLSVRIDLVNETSDAKGGRFELTGARLREGNIDRSFLIKGQTPALAIGDATYGAVAIPANNWIERDETINSNPNQMYMQLYTYENVENTLWIEVKGTFKGEKAEFMLPFRPAPKRNTLYRVAIRNTKTTAVPIVDPNNPPVDPNDPNDPNHPDNPNYPNNPAIEPAITTIDWAEGGVATLTPTQDKAQPVIVSFEPTTGTAQHTATLGTVGDVNTIQEIKLSTPESYQMKLKLHSAGSKPMVLAHTTDIPWITIEPAGKAHISIDGLTQEYLITFGANADLFARTAELEIQNRYYPDKISPRIIKITQPKATTTQNQLAYWAKANVDELNTFAAEVTAENATSPEAQGKLYQWGRNVPIKTPTPPVYSEVIKDFNNPIIWDEKGYYFDNYKTLLQTKFPAYDWIPIPDDMPKATSFNWVEIVNKSTAAPAKYIGNNGGDPSPIGYRLPYKDEWYAILPTERLSTREHLSMDQSARLVDIPEQITLRGDNAPTDFTADYYSTGKNVMYSIKLKTESGEHTMAYKIEIVPHMYGKITARYIGKQNVNIDTVSTEAFWTQNAYSDVVRYYPLAGFIIPAQSILIKVGTIARYHTMETVKNLKSINNGKITTGNSSIDSDDDVNFAMNIRPVLR